MGMLGELFQPKVRDLQAEELADERRLQFQASNPFTAMAHAAYTGADMAGKGAARAGLALAGEDPRSPAEKNTQAVEAAKAQVAKLGFDMDDPKSMDMFYKSVIQILRGQGLVAEAATVAKEWHAQKQGDIKLDLQNQELMRKKAKDEASNELGWARMLQMAQNGIKAGSAVGKILADMDLEQNQTPERRALLKQQLDKVLDPGWTAVDRGDRIELRNKQSGRVIDTAEKAVAPKDKAKDDARAQAASNAYNQALLSLQRQYDAAVELYNMRGVKGMTGRFGRWVGEPEKGLMNQIATVVSPNDARAAFSKHEQVVGGTFLAGLAVLKNASKTGATGLGAVSEKEGDKVQADAAALNRMQEAPDYRKQLATYIRYMEAFADELAAGAASDGAEELRKLARKALTGPSATKGATAPTAVPPTAVPAAAPAAAGDMVRVIRPDGQVGSIPRANLERALQQGYKEAK